MSKEFIKILKLRFLYSGLDLGFQFLESLYSKLEEKKKNYFDKSGYGYDYSDIKIKFYDYRIDDYLIVDDNPLKIKQEIKKLYADILAQNLIDNYTWCKLLNIIITNFTTPKCALTEFQNVVGFFMLSLKKSFDSQYDEVNCDNVFSEKEFLNNSKISNNKIILEKMYKHNLILPLPEEKFKITDKILVFVFYAISFEIFNFELNKFDIFVNSETETHDLADYLNELKYFESKLYNKYFDNLKIRRIIHNNYLMTTDFINEDDFDFSEKFEAWIYKEYYEYQYYWLANDFPHKEIKKINRDLIEGILLHKLLLNNYCLNILISMVIGDFKLEKKNRNILNLMLERSLLFNQFNLNLPQQNDYQGFN